MQGLSKHLKKADSGRTQRLAGIALLAIASLLVVARGFSVVASDGTLSVTLLAIAAIVALGVSRTREGFTGLIGLFFLTTVIFNLGRPILWLIFRDDSVYELTFGLTLSPGGAERADLLLFWCVGIAAFVGGYFVFYRITEPHHPLLSERNATFCRRCFWITLAIVAVSIPLSQRQKWRSSLETDTLAYTPARQLTVSAGCDRLISYFRFCSA